MHGAIIEIHILHQCDTGMKPGASAHTTLMASARSENHWLTPIWNLPKKSNPSASSPGVRSSHCCHNMSILDAKCGGFGHLNNAEERRAFLCFQQVRRLLSIKGIAKTHDVSFWWWQWFIYIYLCVAIYSRVVLLMILNAVFVWHAELVLQQAELVRLESRCGAQHRAIGDEDGYGVE